MHQYRECAKSVFPLGRGPERAVAHCQIRWPSDGVVMALQGLVNLLAGLTRTPLAPGVLDAVHAILEGELLCVRWQPLRAGALVFLFHLPELIIQPLRELHEVDLQRSAELA